MIFATLGNDHRNFSRFCILIEKIAEIQEDNILIQNGYTKYNFKSKKILSKRFLTRDDFLKYLKNAKVIISHAGAGTLMQCVSLQRIPLILPRKRKFNEHINDHQTETAIEFEKQKLAQIIPNKYDSDNLKKILKINIGLNKKIKKSIDEDLIYANPMLDSIKSYVKNYIK